MPDHDRPVRPRLAAVEQRIREILRGGRQGLHHRAFRIEFSSDTVALSAVAREQGGPVLEVGRGRGKRSKEERTCKHFAPPRRLP